MIRHIVMWGLAADAAEQRELDAAAITASLERLVGVVASIRSLRVSRNAEDVELNADLVLEIEFDDRAGLDEYLVHPEHLVAVDVIRPRVSARAAIDVAS
jgi:hypothetical protein